MSDSRREGFLKGLLLGSLAGGIIGLLFAPEKGEKTRNKLDYWLRQFRGDAEHAVGEMKELANKLIFEAKEWTEEGFSRLAQAIKEGRKATNDKIEELKEEE